MPARRRGSRGDRNRLDTGGTAEGQIVDGDVCFRLTDERRGDVERRAARHRTQRRRWRERRVRSTRRVRPGRLSHRVQLEAERGGKRLFELPLFHLQEECNVFVSGRPTHITCGGESSRDGGSRCCRIGEAKGLQGGVRFFGNPPQLLRRSVRLVTTEQPICGTERRLETVEEVTLARIAPVHAPVVERVEPNVLFSRPAVCERCKLRPVRATFVNESPSVGL